MVALTLTLIIFIRNDFKFLSGESTHMKPVAEADGQIYLVPFHHTALFFPLRLNELIADTGEELGRVDFTEGGNDPGIVGYEIFADLLPAVDFEALSVLNDKF